jgi:hypothetical protein
MLLYSAGICLVHLRILLNIIYNLVNIGAGFIWFRFRSLDDNIVQILFSGRRIGSYNLDKAEGIPQCVAWCCSKWAAGVGILVVAAPK